MSIQLTAEQALLAENADLRARLNETEETLRAIRSGEVDALVIESSVGPQIFTLQGLDAELNRFRGEILEQVNDAVIVLDDHQHITYLNAAASEQYGVSASEALGRRVTDIYEQRWLHPEDAANATTALHETDHWRGESMHVKRNGEVFHVESSVTRLHAGRGMHSGILAVIRDITERKRAEEALRIAAEADAYCVVLSDALRPLIDPIDIQAAAAHILGEYLQANRVYYAEVVKNTDTVRISTDYCAGVSSLTGEYHLGDCGPTLMAEFRAGRSLIIPNVAKDTRLIAAEKARMAGLDIAAFVLIPLIRGDSLVGLLGVHQAQPRNWSNAEIADIAETAERTWDAVERGYIEKVLRTSEARLAAIVHQATAGLVETDLSGRFILVNDQFCAILERKREELLTLRWQDITHPDDLAENEALFQRCTDEGRDFVIEKRYLQPDGSAVWVRNSVSLLRDDTSLPMSVLAVSFEIGERRKIEAKLREQTEQLRNADQRKDEFLAMLGHELRNPLTPISNVVRLMSSQSLDEATLNGAYEVLNRNVTHISRLVDDLLDVTRITRGLVTLKQERIDLTALLQECCAAIQDLIDSKQQTLHYRIPEQPVFLEGDGVRLTQVFTNLLNNASKYTDHNGRIDLTVSLDGPSVWVRVRDNGMGISSELLPYVFDLFTQSPRSLDRSEGGLGIGLTLVKQLVELHGGHITAQSCGINQGSEFAVQMPRLPEASAAIELPILKGFSPESSRELRILVIDDNRDVADSLAMLLEILGYQVDIARDGQQGLSAAQRFEPDAILLDIGLPNMDGYQVAQKLREQAVTKQTLIIAMSGYAPNDDDSHEDAADFDHYLIKPPDIRHIQNLITEHQRSKQSTPQPQRS